MVFLLSDPAADDLTPHPATTASNAASETRLIAFAEFDV